MKFISYAQNFEDVMLWRALQGVEDGFYIDIGAQDPIIDSVSFGFYQHGWKGVHVEPSAQYARKLREARPDEIVEESLISNNPEVSEFYVIADTGLSTANPEIAEKHDASGFKVTKALTSVISLDDLLERYTPREIHWLKIDVEGLESDVISSWSKSTARPWILVIESTVPMTRLQSHEAWEALVLEKGYSFVYFDGLNRFYLHSAHADLEQFFKTPPNVFDDVALGGVASNSLCAVLTGKVHDQRILEAELRSEIVAAEAGLASLHKELSDTVEALNNEIGKTKTSAEHEAKLQLEISWLTERLNNTHQALHNVLTSPVWKATFPLRYVIAHWPSHQFARLHPRRIKNSMLRRAKVTTVRTIAIIGKFPRLKAFGVTVLKRTGVYEPLKSRYNAHTARSAQQLIASFEVADLGQRARYIYADLLRRKNN